METRIILNKLIYKYITLKIITDNVVKTCKWSTEKVRPY